MRILYLKSDLLFPLMYYVIAYRKKIVIRNLRASFPEWDERTVIKTAKKFYHYFCDQLIEILCSIFMSRKELSRRFVVRNPEVCNNLYDRGKSITCVLSHYGNWEYSSCFQDVLKHRVIGIYKPLSNKYFDRMVKKKREKYGSQLVAMEKVFRVLVDYESRHIPTITFFLADQRPMRSQIQYWLNFMNQDTPVILGPEKIAKKMNMAVVYLNVIRVKRGFYEAEFSVLFENAGDTSDFEITNKYFEAAEKHIREKPEYWLWTHNRWKHKR